MAGLHGTQLPGRQAWTCFLLRPLGRTCQTGLRSGGPGEDSVARRGGLSSIPGFGFSFVHFETFGVGPRWCLGGGAGVGEKELECVQIQAGAA